VGKKHWIIITKHADLTSGATMGWLLISFLTKEISYIDDDNDDLIGLLKA